MTRRSGSAPIATPHMTSLKATASCRADASCVLGGHEAARQTNGLAAASEPHHSGTLASEYGQVRGMTRDGGRATAGHGNQQATPVLMGHIPPRTVTAMLAAAARAPSVHNTQPWRFAIGEHAIDLYADPSRKLTQDRDGVRPSGRARTREPCSV